MGIPIEIMTAEQFATGVKLQKVTAKRFFAGDKHPLKKIHKKLRELLAMSKGKLDDRHKLMLEIEKHCLSYTGGKSDEKKRSTKVLTVSRLAFQVANRALLERMRGIEIAEKMSKGKGKALVGTLKFEALNVAGPSGIRGDELAKLAKEQFGVELTGDDSKDFYAMKKIMKELKGKGDQFTESFNLVYLDAEQRSRHLLVFTDAPGKGLALKDGEPYTSLTAGLVSKATGQKIKGSQYVAPDMYAVDPEDGSFYTCQDSEYAKNSKIFHHSSFLAGRKALCAGMIVVKDGRLIEISDESGHYKPQVENLLNACEIIVGTGYDPTPDAYVIVHDWAETWKPIEVSQGTDGEERTPATFRVPLVEYLESGGNPKGMMDFNFVPVGYDPVYANPVAAKARGAEVVKL